MCLYSVCSAGFRPQEFGSSDALRARAHKYYTDLGFTFGQAELVLGMFFNLIGRRDLFHPLDVADEMQAHQRIKLSHFIADVERSNGRPLDSQSAQFFRQHPHTVSLVNQILHGETSTPILRRGTHRRSQPSPLDIASSLLDATSEEWEAITSAEIRIIPALKAFERLYPDAGRIVSEAISRYIEKAQDWER